MSRLDMLQWELINSLPITADGASDAMWAITLFTLLILVFVLDSNRKRNRNHRPPYDGNHRPPYDGNHRPPMYHPW